MRLLWLCATLGVIATSTIMHAQEANPPRRDQLVCKSEPRTGSRFERRQCLRREERERKVEDQQRKAGEIINRPIICQGIGAC